MNTFPIFAEIPEMNKREDKNYIVIDPNKAQGGFDIFYYNDFKKPYVDKDWTFELEDAFTAGEQEYGVAKAMWKKMK